MLHLLLFACSSAPPTFGPVSASGSPLLHVPLDAEACRDAGLPEDCTPGIDADSGAVGVSIVARRGDQLLPLALEDTAVEVLHDGARQPARVAPLGAAVESPPVLLLVEPDALTPGIIEAVSRSAAEGRRFMVRSTVAGAPTSAVLDSPEALRGALLSVAPGTSDLYGAVERLAEEAIASQGDTPVALVISQGFPGSGNCADNVEPLGRTVDALTRAHGQRGFELYTMGLGRPYRNAERTPGVPSASSLCGEYGARPVASLAESGVDHLSLQWMADAGGGSSFVRHSADGVAEVVRLVTEPRFPGHRISYHVPDTAMLSTVRSIEIRWRGATATVAVQR